MTGGNVIVIDVNRFKQKYKISVIYLHKFRTLDATDSRPTNLIDLM